MSNARNIASGAKFVDTAGDTMTGNLGVNVSPTAALDVRRSDADGKIAEFHQNGGYGFELSSSQTVARFRSGYLQDMSITTDAGSGATQRMRINSGGNISVPNQHDVVISKKGCLRAGNADTIVGTAAGSNTTSTTMLGCSHYFKQDFSNGRYIHLKTNHPIGPNSGEFSMILFEFMGYRYSPAATIHSLFGVHPWNTGLYSQSSVNNGSYTFFVNEYVSSDNKVVLVCDAGTSSNGVYVGFTLNAYIAHSGYPNLNPMYYNSDGQIKVTAATNTGSTSGAY